jgi:hypothetical protein
MFNLFKFPIFSFATYILACTFAQAGELRETPNIAQCDYLFSGTVERGDAQSIENEIPASAFGTTLCLDSPGGSFIEGINMFHVIWNKDSIATRVLNGDQCQSACAIAFLGGSVVVGTGLIRSQNAVIEPGAVLGFHSPRLVLPRDGVHSASTVEDAYALALNDTFEMFKLTQVIEHGARGMSELLFSKVLATTPSSMYHIDTIGRASLAGIQVSNVPIPELSWQGLINVCNTAFLMAESTDHNSVPDSDAFSHFSTTGIDGSGNPILTDDRVWSWSDDFFMYFVIRGYPAAHVNEKFCKIRLSRIAFAREQELPISERDPTTHTFSILLWQDAFVPVGNTFAAYAETNTKELERVSVPWAALWAPQTPLTAFID